MCGKRRVYDLRESLESPCMLFLWCITPGQEDGYARAEAHLAICKVVTEFIRGKDASDDKCHWRSVLMIHEYSQKLTSDLDKTIGFPIDVAVTGGHYDLYLNRFIDEWVKMLSEFEKLLRLKSVLAE